jgi:CBS domain containing-hemolysin-like protein
MNSGSIPEEGAAIEIDGYKFILESVSETKIETIRVIKLPVETPEVDLENK